MRFVNAKRATYSIIMKTPAGRDPAASGRDLIAT